MDDQYFVMMLKVDLKNALKTNVLNPHGIFQTQARKKHLNVMFILYCFHEFVTFVDDLFIKK